MQPILHLIPNRATAQRPLDNLVQFRLIPGQAMYSWPICDIVIDGFWEGVWLLKDHSNLGPQLNRINLWIVNILAVNPYVAPDAAHIYRIVHAIDAPQKC